MTAAAPATIVRSFLDRVAAGDHPAARRYLDPDARWHGTRGGLDQDRVLRGPEAWIAYLGEIESPWQAFSFQLEQLEEAGDDVLVFLHESGRSQHGDLVLESRTAMVFTVRSGLIVAATGYLDRDEARRAVRARR